MADSVTALAVLRSGGPYDIRHLQVLQRALTANGYWPDDLVCLTDQPEAVESVGIAPIPMIYEWPGWWAKMEMYRPGLFNGPVLYMDLDTLVLGPINELRSLALAGFERPLFLRGYHPVAQRYDYPATGIVVWNGDQMAEVYEAFRLRYERRRAQGEFVGDHVWGGDQNFVRNWINPKYKLQDLLPEGYIAFKRQVRGTEGQRGALDRARLLAWSGGPRFHEAVSSRDQPVIDYWARFAPEETAS